MENNTKTFTIILRDKEALRLHKIVFDLLAQNKIKRHSGRLVVEKLINNFYEATYGVDGELKVSLDETTIDKNNTTIE